MAKRWQRRKEARTAEILEAALCQFAEKGFAATKLDDVAKRAGITKGTIYLYFDSKQALFEALAQGSIGAQMEAVKARLENFPGSSAELLKLVINTMGHFAQTSDRVVLPRMVLAEAANFPKLAEFWRREIIARGLGIFTFIIRRGVERGEFRAVDPEHAARLCVAPVLMIVLWRTTFARFDETPYDHQALIETHLETLLTGLKAP
ncbi:MAG TPA: TetR/AcrR family transcriptional regulator [Rhizomicrobium sp.]|nr:TetR/AcrR family transcriptional regulator [Rhizomicrobium sp.]